MPSSLGNFFLYIFFSLRDKVDQEQKFSLNIYMDCIYDKDYWEATIIKANGEDRSVNLQVIEVEEEDA